MRLIHVPTMIKPCNTFPSASRSYSELVSQVAAPGNGGQGYVELTAPSSMSSRIAFFCVTAMPSCFKKMTSSKFKQKIYSC